MLTKKKWEEAGYKVIPEGSWMAIDPELLAGEWDRMADILGFDPECKEVILGIAAYQEVHFGDDEDEDE